MMIYSPMEPTVIFNSILSFLNLDPNHLTILHLVCLISLVFTMIIILSTLGLLLTIFSVEFRASLARRFPVLDPLYKYLNVNIVIARVIFFILIFYSAFFQVYLFYWLLTGDLNTF